jgi:hypothetical protein
MMYPASAILTLQSDSQAAIEESTRRLEQFGFQVILSFDLKAARSTHVGCTCPYHGTEHCDCQMGVLLVYGQDGPPVTLVIHGHDGQTHIALVDTPDQRPSPPLVDAILRAILPADEQGRKIPNFSLEDRRNAS